MRPIWILLAIALLVAFVFLEGRRQQRKYGRSQRRGLMRTGLLELQQHLEPERKVEFLLEEKKVVESAEAGEPPSEPEHEEKVPEEKVPPESRATLR